MPHIQNHSESQTNITTGFSVSRRASTRREIQGEDHDGPQDWIRQPQPPKAAAQDCCQDGVDKRDGGQVGRNLPLRFARDLHRRFLVRETRQYSNEIANSTGLRIFRILCSMMRPLSGNLPIHVAVGVASA